MPENFYFVRTKRAKSLSSIVFNLLISNHFNKHQFSKNLIYNLLLVLNSRCVEKKVKDGEQPVYIPLDDSEINKLSTFIYNTFIENKVAVKLESCKSIRSQDFVKKYLIDNPEYSGDKHPRTIILCQIHQIKSNSIKNNWKSIISELIMCYPELKAKKYIEILMLEHKLKYNSARDIYYKNK